MTEARNSAAWGGTLLFCCALQFVVLTIAAMGLYPGGAKYVLGADHYLFFQNFFSDLGATRTHSGRNNLPSEVLFVVALSVVGLGMIASSSGRNVIAGKRGHGAGWGVAARVFSILSGACFIGVGVTPWNLKLAAQKIIVYASIVNLGYQALGIRRAAQEMGSEVAGGRTATDSSLLSR
jgi:hypothetical membrane protein